MRWPHSRHRRSAKTPLLGATAAAKHRPKQQGCVSHARVGAASVHQQPAHCLHAVAPDDAEETQRTKRACLQAAWRSPPAPPPERTSTRSPQHLRYVHHPLTKNVAETTVSAAARGGSQETTSATVLARVVVAMGDGDTSGVEATEDAPGATTDSSPVIMRVAAVAGGVVRRVARARAVAVSSAIAQARIASHGHR